MRIQIVLSTFLAASAFAAAPDSPVGLWKTVDDKTGRPRGLVRIYEQDGALYGPIESSFDAAEARDVCDKCPGLRRNQPIVGLVILQGLRKHGSEFSGGEILDPDTGSTYRCRLTLEDKGTRLIVRGYIGLPIAGRSQTWHRTETR